MAVTRIKICGITNIDDAKGAVAAGADALGFVFHPASPRYVAPEEVAQIVAVLPPFVSTVGLFVNTPAVKIHQIMVQTGLQLVQLHGDERATECCLDNYPVTALLLDAWSEEQYGGSGRQFDWQLVNRAMLEKPIILAGGLSPANV